MSRMNGKKTHTHKYEVFPLVETTIFNRMLVDTEQLNIILLFNIEYFGEHVIFHCNRAAALTANNSDFVILIP